MNVAFILPDDFKGENFNDALNELIKYRKEKDLKKLSKPDSINKELTRISVWNELKEIYDKDGRRFHGLIAFGKWENNKWVSFNKD